MSSAIEGGRPLVRIRLFGFPVHLDLSFILIMAALGYYPGVTLTSMALWLLITPLAVLVHELGHAFLARAAGATPEIALAGFGGVTTFTPPGPLSRARSVGISLAGPIVGLLFGGALIVTRSMVGAGLDPSGWQATALEIGIFTCVAWSLLNLLPILPLDGGQAMREVLPGAPQVRERRAAVISVVTGTLAALAAYALYQQVFLAMFMAFFVLSNVLELRKPDSGAGANATPEQAVIQLLWQGQPDRAREVLGSLPGGTTVDLAVHGAVLALTGDPAQGHALLAQELQRRPDDATVPALILLTQTLEHDWDGVVATVQGPLGRQLPPAVVERAVQEARGTGREDVAGRLTLLGRTADPHPEG